MSQTSHERLRDYLAQLPPQSQALLMREFERAIERGEDTIVANFVLEQLRQIVRGTDEYAAPRTDDPARLLFRPLEPFLIDGNYPRRPGQIRRISLLSIWQWLNRDGAPRAGEPVPGRVGRACARPERVPGSKRRVHAFQRVAAGAIAEIATPGMGGDRRALARVGAPDVVEDLLPIGAILQAREALDTFSGYGFRPITGFSGDTQIAAVGASLNVPALQTPQLLPFALSLIMQRLNAPWQIIRLAVKMAASDDEIRVAATPYGVAVTIALHDLAYLAACVRTDIKRGHFDNIAENLKTLHEGVRGLRTELDLRNESTWGASSSPLYGRRSPTRCNRRLTACPAGSGAFCASAPTRISRFASRIDPTEVAEVVALIDFVAVCRTYASELAINEVTLRTYSDLQQYVEQSTEALVQSLRGGDARTSAYRHMQVQAAISFLRGIVRQ